MSNSLDALPFRQRKPLLCISTDISLFIRCSSSSSYGSSSPSNRTITSGTTPSTGISQPFLHVLCMHDFEPSDPVYLPFRKDEVLTIIKRERSGWWAAMRPQGDRIGWIPSSFVLPLDRSEIAEYPYETLALRPCDCLNDHPLSAIHDPWVPVSEDCAAVSFRLVTPTDLVLQKGFFDDGARKLNREPFFSLSNDEQSSDIVDVYVPSTSEGSQKRYLPNPCLSKPRASQLTTTPSLCDGVTVLHQHASST